MHTQKKTEECIFSDINGLKWSITENPTNLQANRSITEQANKLVS